MRNLGSLPGRGMRLIPWWFVGGLLGYLIESRLMGGRGETGITVGIIVGTIAAYFWKRS